MSIACKRLPQKKVDSRTQLLIGCCQFNLFAIKGQKHAINRFEYPDYNAFDNLDAQIK